MTQRRLPPPCRYVYVIGPETGLQKIGIATDPKSRLAALQTASPFRLKIHAAVAVPFGAAHEVERRVHQQLRLFWASGEWFNTTPHEAVVAVKSAAVIYAALGEERAALPLFAFAEAAQIGTKGILPAVTSARRLGRLWKAARRGLAPG